MGMEITPHSNVKDMLASAPDVKAPLSKREDDSNTSFENLLSKNADSKRPAEKAESAQPQAPRSDEGPRNASKAHEQRDQVVQPASKAPRPVVKQVQRDVRGDEDVPLVSGEEIPPPEDKRGAVAMSYDAAVVSYPVKHIASEAVDEDVQTDLKKKGLWDAQGQYTAVPNESLLAMRSMVSTSAIPVQKPIAQFMASLENELGVSPERIVQAFQKLPPGKLQMKPQETMMEVVRNLDLAPKDEQKALSLYTKLLSQMEAMDSNDQSKTAVPTLMAAPVTTGRQAALGEPQGAGSAGLASSAIPAASRFAGGGAPAENIGANSLASSMESSEAEDQTLTGSERFPQGPAFSGHSDFQTRMSEHGSRGQGQADGQANGQTHGQAQNQPENPVAAANQGIKKEIGMSSYKKAEKAANVKSPQVTTNAAAERAVIDRDGDPASSTQAESAVVGKSSNAAQPAAVGGAALAPHADAAKSVKQVEAMREVMDSAKVLATKGGGEMTVSLKNQDLGNVHLRVATKGSEVQINMVAEHGEAKKLIEQNLHELKAGLNQHGFNSENIRVSVADRGAGSDFQQNPQKHPDFGASREFAQQFQQHNRDRHEAMMGGLTGHFGLGERLARRTFESEMGVQSVPRKGVNDGRLDVVA